MLLRVLAGLALATGICMSVAHAQSAEELQGEKARKKAVPPAEQVFKQMNKAGDGHLTMDEFTDGKPAKEKKKFEKIFKLLDTDENGYLTLAQFKKYYNRLHGIKEAKAKDSKDKDNNNDEKSDEEKKTDDNPPPGDAPEQTPQPEGGQ